MNRSFDRLRRAIRSKMRSVGKKKRTLITIILILFQIMGFFSSINAVLRTRTAQGAIAWVISLNTFPIVSVPAYWVFGRSKFNGYVATWRDSSEQIQDQIQRISKGLEPYFVETPKTFPEYEAVKKLAPFQFLSGNRTVLLKDGEQTYESMAAGIERAESYILFQFYILRADGTGERFRRQLIRKAREGVAVYVLYDEMGSSELPPPWLSEFSAAGIKIVPFNTRQGPDNKFQLNFRNHRKIIVVDGKAAWLGGLNIGDDYLGRDPRLTPWRDTHLCIEGPAALAAQASFLPDWYWADRELLVNLNWRPYKAGGSNKSVLVLPTGPADEQETASLFFTNLINVARQRIWIATPYFIPDQATMTALRLALLKGVEVRILTPGLNDNWFVQHAANVYLSELSGLGARIYSYQPGFMHQKVMLVDDRLSVVGSVNFDNRSFRLNFEITGAVADKGFAAQLEEMLRADLSRSTELTGYSLADQSLWERLKARGASLLAPVL